MPRSPSDPRELDRSDSQKPTGGIQSRRLSQVLSDKSNEICQRVLAEMKDDFELASLPLSDEERLDHTRTTLKELAKELEFPSSSAVQRPILPAAAKCGEDRQKQNYPVALLAVNARLLQGVIYDIIRENLLLLNMSNLMLDLKRLNKNLALQAEEIMRRYLQAEKRAP
jgi:hypothetical protein